jgi:hypothetical protein
MPTRVPADHLISLLLDVIPSDQTELREQLTKLRNGWFNIAPELMMNNEYWNPIKYVLGAYVDSFELEWQQKVLQLYNSGGKIESN